MEKHPTLTNKNRREFIQKVAFAGMASFVPFSFTGCGKNQPDIDFLGSGLAPFKVWEEMLMAIKTSPDFLEGRMQELIKNGSPEEMYHFVKDEFFLMPPAGQSLYGMANTMRYGLNGVLRYGFATPREKAELLHKMYREAGIPSEIVYEQTDIGAEEVSAFFFRPFERKFAPNINKKLLKSWQTQLRKEENPAALVKIDSGHKESLELADSLWNLIPEKESLKSPEFDLRWDHYGTPTIAFEWEGGKKYAHLFDPKVPFGSLRNGNEGKVHEAKEAVYTDEQITVTLSYSEGVEFTEEHELVKGTWSLHELAGNRLAIEFANGLTFEEHFYTAIGNLRKFTPIISFQSFDKDLVYQHDRSFIGKTFTLEGEIVGSNEKTTKEAQLDLVGNPKEDLQKQVQKLNIKAIPGNYPFIKIHISPTNAENEFIEGMSASDFLITDNGMAINAILENNQRTPNITILYDHSLSMPDAYYGEEMDLFVMELENKILSKYPAAKIKKWATGSELYTWLLKASQSGSDLIIFATDGDNNDIYDPKWKPNYNAGPPAIILNVYNTKDTGHMETFNNMAEDTSGIVLDAKDQEGTLLKVMDYLEHIEIPPYVFTYYACGEEKNHKVEVNVDAQRVQEETSYTFEVFPEKDQELGMQVSGLYLTVEYGNQTIKRVLAGWDSELHSARKPLFSDFTAVKNTILGGVLMSIEGEGPTLANSLADILKYKLSFREWGEALIEDKMDVAKEAFKKGGQTYNPLLATMMQPIKNGVTSKTFTYASGPRIAILKNYVGINESSSSSISFDYLPFSGYVTLAPVKSQSFKTTLQKTAQLAILEKDMFTKNSFRELQNKKLIERTAAIAEEWFDDKYREGPDAGFWYEIIYRARGENHFKMVDYTASVKSHWQINKTTGELYGILEDGTGGGSQSMEQQIQDIQNVVDVYTSLFDLLKAGGLGVSLVATYGMTLVKLYAIVSETLAIMDAAGMDDKIRAALSELALNLAKDITFGITGPGGEIMGGLDKMIGMM